MISKISYVVQFQGVEACDASVKRGDGYSWRVIERIVTTEEKVHQ